MTPYNRIFQLHADGLNNSEIERTIGTVTRKTVITVLKLADQYGYKYPPPKPMTDTEIHRILHPKKDRIDRMPDSESIVYELSLPGLSIASLWKQYSSRLSKKGIVPYSKAMFQNIVNAAKNEVSLPKYKPLLIFHYIKRAYEDMDGNSRGILFSEMAGSEYVSMTVVPNTKARSWIHALIRIIHNYGAIPSECCFVGHTPKAVAEMTEDCLAYYGMKIIPAGPNKGIVLPNMIQMVLRDWNAKQQEADSLFMNTHWTCKEYNDVCYSGCKSMTRADAFNIEAGTLNSLPKEDYDLIEYADVSVQLNYHVEIDSMFYSVPFELRHDRITAYISDKLVELHCAGAIVAVHDRLTGRKGQYSTDPSHIPPENMIPWNETSGKSLRSWAKKIGPSTLKAVDAFLRQRAYEVQAYKVCNALLHFSERYGAEQLEEACKLACEYHEITYTFIKTILQDKKEGQD